MVESRYKFCKKKIFLKIYLEKALNLPEETMFVQIKLNPTTMNKRSSSAILIKKLKKYI